MEYASEALGWLKKRADVAADRYKRCPAGDPSSIAYGVTAKALQLAVEELGPLVHPAVVEDCGSAPDIRINPECVYKCAIMIDAQRFIVDATRDLQRFVGAKVGIAWKAPNYLTFQDTTSASEWIKSMLIPWDLERLFPAEQSQTEEINGFWIKTNNAHVVEASRDLRWLIGVRTANSECKVHAYSSLAFAEKLLPALVHSDDRVLVQRGLIDMASKLNLASDKRLAVCAGLLRPMKASFYE